MYDFMLRWMGGPLQYRCDVYPALALALIGASALVLSL